MQLTNIIRDVGDDARRGRIYLPMNDLAHFGVKAEEILRREQPWGYSERFDALMRHQAARAHATFDEALARLPDGDRVQVVCADALAWLRDAPGGFDLAFVDPPFAAGLWRTALDAVAARMADDAWLYVEAPHEADAQPAADWRLHREGSTRDVRYAVYRRGA
jgi:hypothetical protein